MTRKDRSITETTASDAEVEAFARQMALTRPRAGPSGAAGRLVFALDATASRQPTWDHACHLQAEMFQAAGEVGGLELQLLFYRGFGECKAGKWTGDTKALLRQMTKVTCLAGHTQIRKVLSHAAKENGKRRVNALVFVGDMVEEDIDQLGHAAGALGLAGVPAFMFQEGRDPGAANAFKQIAKLTGGAYCQFDAGSAAQLRALLRAVAVYAAGGVRALEDHARGATDPVLQITNQMRR